MTMLFSTNVIKYFRLFNSNGCTIFCSFYNGDISTSISFCHLGTVIKLQLSFFVFFCLFHLCFYFIFFRNSNKEPSSMVVILATVIKVRLYFVLFVIVRKSTQVCFCLFHNSNKVRFSFPAFYRQLDASGPAQGNTCRYETLRNTTQAFRKTLSR